MGRDLRIPFPPVILARHETMELLPDIVLFRQLLAQWRELPDVHRGVDILAVGPPDFVEGLIDKLQQAVRSENGDALIQSVQSNPAKIDRVAVTLFQPHSLRHIIKDERQRAVRMRTRENPDI